MNDVFSVECTNSTSFLDDNMIIFVEREYEWYINQYIGRYCSRFRKAFAHFHYDFSYLPVCYDENTARIASKLLMASKDINHALVKFAYMDGDKAVFYCVELDNDEHEESLAKQFYHFACWCTVESERRVKWNEWESNLKEEAQQVMGGLQMQENTPHIQIVNNIDNLETLEECFEFDEDTNEISYADAQLRNLKSIADDLRKMGVSEQRIMEAVEPVVEPAKLEITKDHRIMIPALNKEIVLQPIQKAIFLLFLRHPNGINFKQMENYKNELIELYKTVTGRIDQEVIDGTISKVCNPFDNSIHEKISGLKKVIINQLGDKLAINYIISGKKGEDKKIPLAPDMVIWN